MASSLLKGLGLASGFGGDDPEAFIPPSKGPLDEIADFRDYLTNLVGRGSKTLDPEMKNNYSALVAMYGKPMADRIMNHVFVFNNRPEIQNASPEQRLDAFYAIGSRDKDLQALFNKARNFSYGYKAGLNQSRNEGNIILSGRRKQAPLMNAPGIAQSVINEF